MNINIQFDASVNNAPSGFESAVNAAVQFLDSEFASPVTITIDVGYGEVDGQRLGAGALGESLTNITSVTYSQLVNALPVGTLPATDPTHGGSFLIATAEAKALGISGASGINGYVGFSSTAAFTYDPSNRAVPGEYDFIGVVEHEITEVMGRISMLDSGAYSLMDLFRYSAPDVRSLTANQAAYFSVDGGQTNLDNFNSNPGGDLGDWAASAGNDAFLAFSNPGVMLAFSAADVVLMDTLGYGASSPVVSAIVEQPSTGDLNAGKTVTITLDLSKMVTITGGSPTLMLNDGGIAHYASGSGSNALSFLYTVAASDASVASLTVTSVNLNDATIADSGGNAANLSLAGLTQNGPEINFSGVSAQDIQNDYLAIARASLPLDQATAIADAINAGTQTETQYVNGLLAQVANTTIPAVAVEGTMYNAVGTSAEITSLVVNFLPAQLAHATQGGFNLTVFACEALGLAFASGNETGATTFATNFGPSNPSMPNTAAGDAAFAAAACSAIFGSQSTQNLVNFVTSHITYWLDIYTANGLPGISHPTANQIDLAARGAAWGEVLGVGLANSLGPLPALVTNFLEDAAQGTAVYSASLASEPPASPFQGAATASTASTTTHVQMIGVAAPFDHIHT